jgi:SPRY domain-containing SOCS box protein 3
MPQQHDDEEASSYVPLPKRCPSYCDCEFPNCVSLISYKGYIPDLVKCRCGEDVTNTPSMHWLWHQQSIEEDGTDAIAATADTLVRGGDITFHQIYSQGTAIVRGERELKVGMVHFWEMRIITALAGTDVMFGIGTDKVDLNQFKFHFISALGSNAQSWGFSYHGKIQHNGIKRPYGQKFTQGCIVGVFLDRTRGHLEFFLNRRSLGIAYTNIPLDPSVRLYPMVCSTAAKSVVRLINSTSQLDCLQLRAFKALSKQSKALAELQQMPGLRPVINSYWFLAPPTRYSQRSVEHDIADEAVLSKAQVSRLGRKQKFKDDDTDINDLYSNAHKIAVKNENRVELEPEFALCEYFDEFFHYLF